MKHVGCCRWRRSPRWLCKDGIAHRGPCSEKATAAKAAAAALLMYHSAAVPAASRGRRLCPQAGVGDRGGGVSGRRGDGGGRGVGGRGGARRLKKQPPRLQRHSAAVPAASRGRDPSPQARVGNSGCGVSGRSGCGGSRCVGGRGGGRRHIEQLPGLLRLRRPALTPRLPRSGTRGGGSASLSTSAGKRRSAPRVTHAPRPARAPRRRHARKSRARGGAHVKLL